MSDATISRINNILQRQFENLIDMSDWNGRPIDQIKSAFLSRALAALCVKSASKCSPEVAASSIIDGMDDCGIDAVHFDVPSDTLVIVQSKWSGGGNNTINEAAASKFINGVRALLAAKFEKFNSKMRAHEAEIREVLYSDRAIKIHLVVAHTSAQPIAAHVSRIIEEFVTELNDPVSIAYYSDYNQAGIYDLITSEAKDPKIKLQAVLNDWGVIERPFLAYYGRVSTKQITEWWSQHRNKLFSQNLRLFYQNSSVNDALKKTLQEDPENFWYFNNGITIISDRIVKGIAGSPAHKFGNFTCEGASIVNGAQTVGTIGCTMEDETPYPESEEGNSWVQVRLISLEKCPPEFAGRITRAANLQNAVGTREFAAMDPLQHRLAVEFALDKRRYVYKSGETDPKSDEGCSILEATQALGCQQSVKLAVDVKREIGSVWSDTEAPPYTDIFNEKLTAIHVWKAVLVMRRTDDELQKLRRMEHPKADMVGVHMNRIILHLVFKDSEVRKCLSSSSSWDYMPQAVANSVGDVFEKIIAYIEAKHPLEYLASLCKNQLKCTAMVDAILNPNAEVALPQQHSFVFSN